MIYQITLFEFCLFFYYLLDKPFRQFGHVMFVYFPATEVPSVYFYINYIIELEKLNESSRFW